MLSPPSKGIQHNNPLCLAFSDIFMFTIYFNMELKYELYMHLKNQNVQVHEVVGIKYMSY